MNIIFIVLVFLDLKEKFCLYDEIKYIFIVVTIYCLKFMYCFV